VRVRVGRSQYSPRLGSDPCLRSAVASSRILALRAEACFSVNGSLSARAARILSRDLSVCQIVLGVTTSCVKNKCNSAFYDSVIWFVF
jgi:hypothetical protein